jgi:hypothetical protein
LGFELGDIGQVPSRNFDCLPFTPPLVAFSSPSDGVLTIWVLVLPNLTWSKLFFTRARLSYVRVIMTFMRVSLVEPLRQAAMGRISVLEYMLLGARGLLRPRPIVPGTKCYRFPRPLMLVMPIHC